MSQISLSHREDYERLLRAGVACATLAAIIWNFYPPEKLTIYPDGQYIVGFNVSFAF